MKILFTAILDIWLFGQGMCLNTQEFIIEPADTTYDYCNQPVLSCTFKFAGVGIWAKVTGGGSARETLFQLQLRPTIPAAGQNGLIHFKDVYMAVVKPSFALNLRIAGATPSAEGQYECLGMADDGVLIRKEVTLSLNNGTSKLCSSLSLVDKVAWVDVSGDSNVGTGTQCQSKFRCNCGSVMTAKWYENGGHQPAWGTGLTFGPRQPSVANAKITCRCVNGATTHEPSNSITVRFANDRPMMNIYPTRFPVAGSTVTLRCAIGCTHPSNPGIVFKKDTVALHTGVRPPAAQWDITPFAEADNGEYTCKHKIGQGGFGRPSFPVTIQIKIDLTPPPPTTPPPPATECKAPDSPTPAVLPSVLGALLCCLVTIITIWLLLRCYPVPKRVSEPKPPTPPLPTPPRPPTPPESVMSSSVTTESSIPSSIPSSKPPSSSKYIAFANFEEIQDTDDEYIMLWFPDQLALSK